MSVTDQRLDSFLNVISAASAAKLATRVSIFPNFDLGGQSGLCDSILCVACETRHPDSSLQILPTAFMSTGVRIKKKIMTKYKTPNWITVFHRSA